MKGGGKGDVKGDVKTVQPGVDAYFPVDNKKTRGQRAKKRSTNAKSASAGPTQLVGRVRSKTERYV